jgi:hypothetical protein
MLDITSDTLREDALGIYGVFPKLGPFVVSSSSREQGIFELENGGGLFGRESVH